ncbi:hypothetical protein SADFL11_00039250 [Roseibium alexandrii DFL-11]|uniref:Uncharacterized protein n=1 Tax=Roseibium alexandrii (strain DSM 17067 / NCIMB 14079 / DFL-11) TaxID=244592 RepID=A0A5E8UXA1_ROSAD|nr:hypothetical protein SADFL11_00039250 [Roseibium alexandrii DFL-11]
MRILFVHPNYHSGGRGNRRELAFLPGSPTSRGASKKAGFDDFISSMP